MPKGKFPDYNDDGGLNVLDILEAPSEAKAAVTKMVM